MTDLARLSDAQLDALEAQLSQQQASRFDGRPLADLSDLELDQLEAQIAGARPEPEAYQRIMQSGFPGAETAMGVLKGVADVAQTANQGAGWATDMLGVTDGRADRVDAMNAGKNAEYEGTRSDDGFDWGRLGGQVIATAPAGAFAPIARAGRVGEMLNAASQGAVGAAAVSSANEEPLHEQVSLGAAAGIAAPPLLRAAGRAATAAAAPAINKMRQAADYVTGNISAALGTLSSMGDDLAAIRKGLAAGIPEAQVALQNYVEGQLQRVGQQWHEMMPEAQESLLRQAETMLRGSGEVAAETAARRADMDAIGVRGTSGSVTRDPRLWQFEQNTAGVAGEAGDQLTQRFRDDNRVLVERLAEIGRGTGGRAASPYEAGERSVEAVQGKWREMQEEVGGLYKQIREQAGDGIGFRGNRLFNALEEHSLEAAGDNITNSVTRWLKKVNLIDPETGAFNAAQPLKVSQAEELRKFIGRLSDGNDPAVQRIKRSLVDALDDDVIETAAGDAFRPARDAARRRFEEFAPKTLKNVVEEKTVADDVLRRNVLGAKVGDLAAFKRSLTTGNAQQMERGTQAWDDLRLQTLEHIMREATDAGGKLQGSRLSKSLDGIGNERLRLIFTPEELNQIGTIRRVAYNTTVAVPESRVNYSGTGAMLADLMGRMGVGKSVQKVAQGVTNIPIVGPLVSPVTGLANMAGKAIDEAAVNKAVAKALDASPAAVATVMKQAGYREKVAEYLRMLPASPASAEALAMISGSPNTGDGSGKLLRVDIPAPTR